MGFFSLSGAILAFCTGCVGGSLGALQSFIFTGLVGLAGLGLLVGGIGDVIGSIAFNFWFAPPMAFLGGVLATAYAKSRGLTDSGKNITTPLITTRRIDVVAMGGLGGFIGYLVSNILTGTLGIKVDGGGITIWIVSICIKLIFDKSVFGTVPDEIKQKGGRFSTKHDMCWSPAQRSYGMKFMMGLIWGGVAAYAAYTMTQAGINTNNEVLRDNGYFITFFISASSLMFAAMGFGIPTTHHITLPAAYAVYDLMKANKFAADLDLMNLLIWGMAIGIAGGLIGDLLADVFCVYGDVHIDPPAMAICTTSLFCHYVLQPESSAGMLGNIIIPIIIIGVAAVLAVMDNGIKANPGKA